MIRKSERIIIYDGKCAACNSFIDYFLARLGVEHSWMVVSQSCGGWELCVDDRMKEFIDNNKDESIVVVNMVTGDAHIRSVAILDIISDCEGLSVQILSSFLKHIPVNISDTIYRIIARLRRLTYRKSQGACSVACRELIVKKGRLNREVIVN